MCVNHDLYNKLISVRVVLSCLSATVVVLLSMVSKIDLTLFAQLCLLLCSHLGIFLLHLIERLNVCIIVNASFRAEPFANMEDAT